MTIVLFQDPSEPEVWYGAVPAMRGVHSDGATRDEALKMTTLALEGTLELFFELGRLLPSVATDLDFGLAQIRTDFGLPDAAFETVRVDLSVSFTASALFETEVRSFATASG